jgi:hypothetical protein
MEGPGPSETVVAIHTREGKEEEVILHRSLVTNGSIEVGGVAVEDHSTLVELPTESASGNWRIWVDNGVLA